MSARIIRGNALALPLADESVDLVVTSPPYFGLRSYQDGGEHYAGQIGSEATPAEFVDALIAATREMVRVLKPSGSIWVNLGDKYAGNDPHGRNNNGSSGLLNTAIRDGERAAVVDGAGRGIGRRPNNQGIPTKSLIGIPWRYALRCIDDLGLILRAEVIWSKPNGLPESVTDRVRRSHEQWFHFTLQPRYYSAVDEIRESTTDYRSARPLPLADRGRVMVPGNTPRSTDGLAQTSMAPNPLGKLPGSVWTINEGESLVRSVLNAVATQGITADEGERILLWTARDSGRAQPNGQTDAGNGRGSSRQTATAATTPSTKGLAQPTESPISSPSDPSPTGSPSTTPAATGHASTPTTSSPSQSRSTSPDDPSRTSVPAATTTTSATPTSGPTASESAGSAWQSGRDGREQHSGPPSVWVVPTQPLTVPPELGIDHFAAFPMDWPRRIIQGWSPAGVCTACGEGRRPVTTKHHERPVGDWNPERNVENRPVSLARPTSQVTVDGYACACPDTAAPTRPAVILDPFGGTGTTALVAKALGRTGISVDMSADYCRLAQWRTTDPGELARAMQVEKPAKQVEGQISMLDLLDEDGGAA